MRARALPAALLAILAALAFHPAATHAAIRDHTGSLSSYISGFVSSIPRAGSEAYYPPSLSEASSMRRAFQQVQAGQLSKAASLARPYGYDVVRFSDTESGRRFDLLAERRSSDGSYAHAWGLFVHRRGSDSRLTVEVPHPVADVATEQVGLEILSRYSAADLLVAGAHRYANADGSADVAHRADSVFQAVHEAAVGPGDRAVQPHGFSEVSHSDVGDVVVSSGAAPPSALATSTAASLANAGFAACLYDGVLCRALAGTTNVQGSHARGVGGDFLHLEIARWIRDDTPIRLKLVAALEPLR